MCIVVLSSCYKNNFFSALWSPVICLSVNIFIFFSRNHRSVSIKLLSKTNRPIFQPRLAQTIFGLLGFSLFFHMKDHSFIQKTSFFLLISFFATYWYSLVAHVSVWAMWPTCLSFIVYELINVIHRALSFHLEMSQHHIIIIY